MSTVKVSWLASEALIKAELAAAGESGPSKRTATFDLKAMTPGQRFGLLRLVGVGANGELGGLDITQGIAAMPEGETAPCYRIGHGMYVAWRDELVQLDAEPDVLTAIQVAQVIEGQLAEARKAYAAEKSVKDAQDAEERRAKAEKRAAQVAQYKSVLPVLQGLISLKAVETLKAFEVPSDLWGFEPSSWELSDGNPYNAEKSLGTLRRDALKALHEEMAHAEKGTWINAHGSAHLQRAFGKGYDCLRRYVVERAALEAPGFTVDFDNKSDWKSRPCPSTNALDTEDEAAPIAEALKLSGLEVVWLTSPAQDHRLGSCGLDDEDEGCFDPCEAVVMRGYLGKYDLVRIV